jgi:superfamily II DNA or RNA helicase
MAELLNRKDLRVAKYHTKLSKLERYDNLSKFKDGIADVLISCKSLDEGFDVPDAESAIIVSSSASVRQRIQRMGRVLRKTKKNKNARIYTLYSSDRERERLEKEVEQFNYEVNVIWKKIEAND